MREEINRLKEQNPLQNISNIVPSGSHIKTKSLFRPESAVQVKIIEDFELTEQFIANPQMFFILNSNKIQYFFNFI